MEELTERAVAICEKFGWGLGWKDRGVYLSLESAELIEAMRGKGDSTVTEVVEHAVTKEITTWKVTCEVSIDFYAWEER